MSLILSIILLFPFLLISVHGENPDVLDGGGKLLEPGTEYIMLTLLPLDAGDVTLAVLPNASTTSGSCPARVALQKSLFDSGIPVRVTLPQVGEAAGVDREGGEPFQIGFSQPFHCVPTAPWAGEVGENGKAYLVPVPEGGSWFTMDVFNKRTHLYHLNYCSAGDGEAGGCERVGAYEEEDQYYLVVGGDEFVFAFIKPDLRGASTAPYIKYLKYSGKYHEEH